MSSPLYRRVLGPRFLVLPRRVRELHELASASQWAGVANVERGRSRLSRLAAWIIGLPLPRLVHPSVRTWECERDGRYQFEVEARLPLIGLIVRYGGWLVRQG